MKALLRNAFVPGQVLRYRARTNVRQELTQNDQATGDSDHEWKAVLVQEVLAVDADGSAHIITRAALEDVDPAGTEGALEAQRVVTYTKLDPRGNVKLSSNASTAASYTLPEGEVEIGDEWSDEALYPLPPTGQTAPVAFRYTWARTEDFGGRDCAVIEVHAASSEWEVLLPETQETILVSVAIEGTLWFDLEAGLMVRSDVSTMAMPRVGTQTVTTRTRVTQELERVQAPAAAG